jgi:hypothetical protein
MSPIEAALLIAALALAFHFVVRWQLGLLASPRYLRNHGVVICRDDVVEYSGEVIGSYRGCDIHESVVFMGMRYRFERVASPSCPIKARELLIAPGLVYVTD